MTDDAIIKQALERFQLAAEAETEQRQREREDLDFEFDPWPDAAKQARAGFTAAGVQVPERPMLKIPMLDQPIQLVINQEKAAHLSITIHPEGDDATDDTAEIQQGLIRHIDATSRAGLARSWAFERAVRCGRGYYRINKRACRETTGLGAFDQELVIERILNQFAVYLDPDALEPDFRDGLFAFITQDLSPQRYKREFPDSDLAGMNDLAFESLGDQAGPWVTSEYYRIAEYFSVETSKRTKVAYQQPDESIADGWQDELPKDYPPERIKNSRDIQERKVIWRKINGVEVLKEIEWDGRFIPIVPVLGREYNLNGKRRWTGVIGPAKDSARLVNYTSSLAAEKIAIDVKSPWIIAEGQEEGHEAEFVRASARPVPYVRYKPTSLMGQVVEPPQRNLQGPDLSADIAMLQVAKEFVHASTFTFDPSLGNLPQKDRSGKAIQALQQQADAGNSHYLDNLAEISIRLEGDILLDMLGAIYDRPGREVRIIDPTDEPQRVLLNQPYRQDPTGKPQPAQPGDPQAKHHDLKRGAYGVTVSAGKSYQTRMQQGSDALGQLLQADPALMPVIGWRYFKYNDNIPGHNEIADDMKKLRPPQLQDDGQGPDPQQLQAKIAALSQQHQALVQELNAKTQAIETDQVKYQAQVAIEQEKGKLQVLLQSMKDATMIQLKEIDARIKGVDAHQTAVHEAAAMGEQFAHEAALETAKATHAQQMAELQHQQAMEQGEQQASNQAALGEQAHGQALEQQQQAADLAPEPSANA